MSRDRVDRLGLAAGLLAWAAVAFPGLTGVPGFSPPWAWWLGYLVNGALFAVESLPRLAGRPRLARWLLAPQVLAGVVVFVLDPAYGFSGVLLVLNAVTAAYLLPVRWVLGLVAAQTVVVALSSLRVAPQGPSALTIAAAYGGLQVFGC